MELVVFISFTTLLPKPPDSGAYRSYMEFPSFIPPIRAAMLMNICTSSFLFVPWLDEAFFQDFFWRIFFVVFQTFSKRFLLVRNQLKTDFYEDFFKKFIFLINWLEILKKK